MVIESKNYIIIRKKKRTVGISMFSASVNKPCNSSTVVDHGMLPTYKRSDCGCSVDMVFVFSVCFSECFNGFSECFNGEMRPIRWRLRSLKKTLNNRTSIKFLGGKERKNA